MHNHQSNFLGLLGTVATIRAIVATPTITAHYQLLIDSVKTRGLAVQAAQLAIGAQLKPSGLGLTFASSGLGLGIAANQLAKAIETSGLANLASQLSPTSGFIQSSIVPELARVTALSDILAYHRKQQKRNRIDFNDLILPSGKGKKISGSGSNRYILHDN